jgi:hypothetical protein
LSLATAALRFIGYLAAEAHHSTIRFVAEMPGTTGM